MGKGVTRMDMGLFIALLLMLGFGIVLVYSSSFAVAEQRFGGSEFFFSRQMVRALIALAGFMIFINVDYHVWSRLGNLGYLIALILLVVVLALPASTAVNGAKRWLSVGFFTFQVSDLARMALVLFLARNVERAGTQITEWRVYVRLTGTILIVCLLICMQPGFSTSAIIGLIGFTMLFMAGARVIHLLGLVAAAIPAAVAIAVKMPHSRLRIMNFIHGRENIEDMGYQAYQSLIGLGNGGLFGVGLGKGEQKFFYLPEPHTDFVISILGEEIGFVGLIIVMSVFAFIVYRGMNIALKASDKVGQLMAFGFTFSIAVYALLHACVGVGLLPTTGVPLPFISYGGMSLVFMMSSMGVVLNISSQSRYAAPVVQNASVRRHAGKKC